MHICKLIMYSFWAKPKCTFSYQVMCIFFENNIQANKKLLI